MSTRSAAVCWAVRIRASSSTSRWRSNADPCLPSVSELELSPLKLARVVLGDDRVGNDPDEVDEAEGDAVEALPSASGRTGGETSLELPFLRPLGFG
jgi:hypothetical protein